MQGSLQFTSHVSENDGVQIIQKISQSMFPVILVLGTKNLITYSIFILGLLVKTFH
jgi:hypothetical protein